MVVFWLWINLLPFNIDNQRRREAILEDKVNKPWRTMPHGRMTPTEAKVLMLCLYPTALCTSLWIGGVRQSLALIVLGCFYNELNLADRSWVSRNAINALGFCCFTSGALEVVLSTSLQFTTAELSHMIRWLEAIAAVVFSTVQIQDLVDQAGDRLRKRKTMPLVLGDRTARWSTAVSIVVWSIFCPLFWNLGIGLFFVFGGLGIFIAYRIVAFCSAVADNRSFLLWDVWMTLLYSLPLVAAM
ncbi:UbiA prenyltransferase family [Annulohypoxylon stygium]|nr:UbiA prenyltransferase family [Annulohypoxylon stygium]